MRRAQRRVLRLHALELAEHDPDALVSLREVGTAEILLTEGDYDRDFWMPAGSAVHRALISSF